MTIYNIVERDTRILVSQPRALQTVNKQELEKAEDFNQESLEHLRKVKDLEEIRKLFKWPKQKKLWIKLQSITYQDRLERIELSIIDCFVNFMKRWTNEEIFSILNPILILFTVGIALSNVITP